MKIIFLDVDGVMNTPKEWGKHLGNPSNAFNKGCVENLNKIVEKFDDVRIVISSTWRFSYTKEEIGKFLTNNGFKYADRIISETPKLNKSRGSEIAQWFFETVVEVDNFIILDDMSAYEMVPYQKHLIQTDGSSGLTEAEVERAIEFLED